MEWGNLELDGECPGSHEGNSGGYTYSSLEYEFKNSRRVFWRGAQ